MTITKVPGISLGIASLMVITEKEEAQKKKGGGAADDRLVRIRGRGRPAGDIFIPWWPDLWLQTDIGMMVGGGIVVTD